MKIFIKTALLLALLGACSTKTETPTLRPQPTTESTVAAVDISSFPEIEQANTTFFNRAGDPQDFLEILSSNGVNTVRLRVWVNTVTGHSSLKEVITFSQSLRQMGFKIWLSVHYSDTWADPGQQEIPSIWQTATFNELKSIVKSYSLQVARLVQPDYYQIGNEINNGFLHPYGRLSAEPQQFKELAREAINGVRQGAPQSRIILHYAGLNGAQWFFNTVDSLDYDVIGLSYYPIWHGKDLVLLKNTMDSLTNKFNREIIIAETAYPFTLEWNDYTNNIVGLEEQLILPQFPATPQGQADFVREIRNISTQVKNGLGFCYWGAELVAWKGPLATQASPWENQALFDFSNRALPALKQFKNDTL